MSAMLKGLPDSSAELEAGQSALKTNSIPFVN